MAVVRMLLPAVLLLVMVPRWFHARELFSLDGAPAPLADNYGYFDFPARAERPYGRCIGDVARSDAVDVEPGLVHLDYRFAFRSCSTRI